MARRLLVGSLAVAAALVIPASAQAATASLTVSPKSTTPGSVVHVSGSCEPSTSGFAISSAFLHDAAHDFAGVGAVPFSTDKSGRFSVDATIPAGRSPGSYTVTARCGGGNLGISVALTVTSGGPTSVPAGSGGQAAVGGVPADTWLLACAGALLVGAGALSLRRRPSRS